MRPAPSPRPHAADLRPGGLLRGALVLLLLALVPTVAVANGTADLDALPEGTIPAATLPPYHPDETLTREAIEAWCEACEARGVREPGTRRGGDLLFAAADVSRTFRLDLARVAQRYELAWKAYPEGDVTRAVVLVRWTQHVSARGNAPLRTTLLERIEAWRNVREPRDAARAELTRWQHWHMLRRLELPLLSAEEHEANGRLREAADVLSTLAREESAALARRVPTDLRGRAARLYYRADLRKEALQANEDAVASIRVETSDDERARVRLRFWGLYARHGILTDDAQPRVDGRWPDGFDEDLRTFLTSLQGTEGLATTHLSLASRAYAAKRYERALDIYLLALRDPTIVAQARQDSSIWGGLLMAYAAAMELERFDEAERILGVVERLAEEPFPAKDAYLVAVAKARREVAERPLREEARRKLAAAKAEHAKREAAREVADERGPSARIETGEGDVDAEPDPEDGAGAGEVDASLLTLLGGVLGVLALLVVMVRLARLSRR